MQILSINNCIFVGNKQMTLTIPLYGGSTMQIYVLGVLNRENELLNHKVFHRWLFFKIFNIFKKYFYLYFSLQEWNSSI